MKHSQRKSSTNGMLFKAKIETKPGLPKKPQSKADRLLLAHEDKARRAELLQQRLIAEGMRSMGDEAD